MLNAGNRSLTKCHGGCRRHLTNLTTERSPKINGHVVKFPTRVFLLMMYLAWENSRHFVTSLLVFPRNDFWGTSAEIPYWWRHYPDLGSASAWLCREGKLLQPIKSRLTFDCFLWPSRAKSVYQYVMLIRLSYCLWSVIAASNFFNIAPWCDPTEPL